TRKACALRSAPRRSSTRSSSASRRCDSPTSHDRPLMTLNLGWFTTARGPGSRGMFEAIRVAIDTSALDARFAYVFVNREAGEAPLTDGFFNLVRDADIPLLTRSSVGFRHEHGGRRSVSGEPLPEWREAFDEEVAHLVAPYDAEVSVLAGY